MTIIASGHWVSHWPTRPTKILRFGSWGGLPIKSHCAYNPIRFPRSRSVVLERRTFACFCEKNRARSLQKPSTTTHWPRSSSASATRPENETCFAFSKLQSTGSDHAFRMNSSLGGGSMSCAAKANGSESPENQTREAKKRPSISVF